MNIQPDTLAILVTVFANFLALVNIAVKFERRFTKLEVNMEHVQQGLHRAGVLQTRAQDEQQY